MISKVAQNSPVGRQMAWDFILRHWDVLETRYDIRHFSVHVFCLFRLNEPRRLTVNILVGE